MRIINCQQQTDEWYQARLGIPTASSFDKIIMASGKASTQREKYLYKLAGEILSGKTEETFQTQAMARGCELEQEAREFYSFFTNNEIYQVGLCLHDELNAGASPDGLIDNNGLVEIKCPSMSVHVEYLAGGKLPSAYFQQVQGQLFITGRQWCDFISYYPGIKPFLIRVEPDTQFHDLLAVELLIFCNDLVKLTEKLR